QGAWSGFGGTHDRRRHHRGHAIAGPPLRRTELAAMAESLRALIAGDEALHNPALTSQVETLRHQVVAMSTSGRQAAEPARDSKPALAFLDLRMPGMTGPQAAQQIAAERPIPIITLSAYSDERTVEEATRSPVFHYLVKPVDPDDL